RRGDHHEAVRAVPQPAPDRLDVQLAAQQRHVRHAGPDRGDGAAHQGARGGEPDHAVLESHRDHRAGARGARQVDRRRSEAAMRRSCIRSRRVITPEGARPASIHIDERGGIERVGPWEDWGDVPVSHDCDDWVIMPGIVDTHVHLNEPGRTEWEGFATATRAAAIGGITTVVDMPLNSIPPTTTREAFAAKRAAARGQCSVDVGFWGGVVPGNAGELVGLVADGVRGFKASRVDSGVAEFGGVGEAELAPARGILSGLGVPLLVHAELAGPIDAATAGLAGADPCRYATYLASRPPAAEEQAIA